MSSWLMSRQHLPTRQPGIQKRSQCFRNRVTKLLLNCSLHEHYCIVCHRRGLSVRRVRLYEAETDEERDEDSQSCGIGDAVRTTTGGQT